MWACSLLAVLAIMALHAGANVVNDYFDSQSRNDWVNENPTPFSGGRQFIQKRHPFAQGDVADRAGLSGRRRRASGW